MEIVEVPGDGRVYFTKWNRMERNVSMELLQYKIWNGTLKIISCDPSDHISTCIRHYSHIKTLYKVFYSIVHLILLDIAIEPAKAFARCLRLATYLSVSYYISIN